MCRAVRCSSCGKTGWAGCGAHVDQVMAGVPASERCRCREEGATRSTGGGQQGSLWDAVKGAFSGRPRS